MPATLAVLHKFMKRMSRWMSTNKWCSAKEEFHEKHTKNHTDIISHRCLGRLVYCVTNRTLWIVVYLSNYMRVLIYLYRRLHKINSRESEERKMLLFFFISTCLFCFILFANCTCSLQYLQSIYTRNNSNVTYLLIAVM